jgi:Zn ribbon nucleic-acid-binding protein
MAWYGRCPICGSPEVYEEGEEDPLGEPYEESICLVCGYWERENPATLRRTIKTDNTF